MLYKIDYIRRSTMQEESKFVNHVADQTEAVKRFMDWFFANNEGDAVKPVRSTCIEMIGDLSNVDVIDAACVHEGRRR